MVAAAYDWTRRFDLIMDRRDSNSDRKRRMTLTIFEVKGCTVIRNIDVMGAERKLNALEAAGGSRHYAARMFFLF